MQNSKHIAAVMAEYIDDYYKWLNTIFETEIKGQRRKVIEDIVVQGISVSGQELRINGYFVTGIHPSLNGLALYLAQRARLEVLDADGE